MCYIVFVLFLLGAMDKCLPITYTVHVLHRKEITIVTYPQKVRSHSVNMYSINKYNLYGTLGQNVNTLHCEHKCSASSIYGSI
jgi:hypothetical protein